MTDQNQIKYRADGSIDIEHYTRIGRKLRSEQAVGMLTGGATSIGVSLRNFRKLTGFPSGKSSKRPSKTFMRSARLPPCGSLAKG